MELEMPPPPPLRQSLNEVPALQMRVPDTGHVATRASPREGHADVSTAPPALRSSASQRPGGEPGRWTSPRNKISARALSQPASMACCREARRARSPRCPSSLHGVRKSSGGAEAAVWLKLGEPAEARPHSGEVQGEVCLTVLKGLLGDEMRHIVREEVRAAMAPQHSFVVTRDDAAVFEFAGSWTVLHSLKAGDVVYPAAPPRVVDGFAMQPILPSGAVQSDNLRRQVQGSALEESRADVAEASPLETPADLDVDDSTPGDEEGDWPHRKCGEPERGRFLALKRSLTDSESPISWVPLGIISGVQQLWGNLGVRHVDRPASCLTCMLQSTWWNTLVNLVVIANVAFMVFTVNYTVQHYPSSGPASDQFMWVDAGFLVFYALEFVLMFACYKVDYFIGPDWFQNLFNFLLMVSSLASLTVANVWGKDGPLDRLTWLRLFRLCRLALLSRLVGAGKHLKVLKAILGSLQGSFMTLVWSLLVMTLVYFVSALVLVSRVADILQGQGSFSEAGEHAALFLQFGSVERAMYSLCGSTTGGQDWSAAYDALALTGDTLTLVIFIFLIFFIQIALVNTILGLFVEEAMKRMRPSAVEQAHHLALERTESQRRLVTMLEKMGRDEDRTLSLQEWRVAVEQQETQDRLEALGFRASQIDGFLRSQLASSQRAGGASGESPGERPRVDIDNFAKGCMLLSGGATAFDTNAVLSKLALMNSAVAKELKQIRRCVGAN